MFEAGILTIDENTGEVKDHTGSTLVAAKEPPFVIVREK